jgi:hypothetical protein
VLVFYNPSVVGKRPQLGVNLDCQVAFCDVIHETAIAFHELKLLYFQKKLNLLKLLFKNMPKESV